MKPKTIIALVISLLFLIILIQNTHPVTFHFFFWSRTMSQIIILFFALLVGLIIGYLAPIIFKKWRIRI